MAFNRGRAKSAGIVFESVDLVHPELAFWVLPLSSWLWLCIQRVAETTLGSAWDTLVS